MKFRVRNTETGELYTEKRAVIDTDGNILLWSDKINNFFIATDVDNNYSPGHLKPEFSTGQTDKNGVEIFENDRVRFFPNKLYRDNFLTMDVLFKNQKFYLKGLGKNVVWRDLEVITQPETP